MKGGDDLSTDAHFGMHENEILFELSITLWTTTVKDDDNDDGGDDGDDNDDGGCDYQIDIHSP